MAGGCQLHGIPVWLTRKPLPKIAIKPGQTIFALMHRLQRLDERVGSAFSWHYFMLHGNRIGPSVGEQVAGAADDGISRCRAGIATCLGSGRPLFSIANVSDDPGRALKKRPPI
jgi:hypothetical protein